MDNKEAGTPCPGSKIRSKGLGAGLGRGKGTGPIGVPINSDDGFGRGRGRGRGRRIWRINLDENDTARGRGLGPCGGGLARGRN